MLDRQAELVARLLDARRRGNAMCPFDAAFSGKPPNFTGGIRYQDVRRMSNYLKSKPYRACLDRLLTSLRTG